MDEVGKCFCHATAEISNARQCTPMTSHHIQTLKNIYPEYTMYFSALKRCKLPHYRSKSRAERCLSQEALEPHPAPGDLAEDNDPQPLGHTRKLHERAKCVHFPMPPRDLPDPCRLRYKSYLGRHAQRPWIKTRPEQAPATPPASSALPPHIAQFSRITN